ncbi:MAG: hypothetical protein KDK51_03715 [Deltaproteobacteria bacterium]|nr:hypothetical protein [Deltaproteobacteria bacterium]
MKKRFTHSVIGGVMTLSLLSFQTAFAQNAKVQSYKLDNSTSDSTPVVQTSNPYKSLNSIVKRGNGTGQSVEQAFADVSNFVDGKDAQGDKTSVYDQIRHQVHLATLNWDPIVLNLPSDECGEHTDDVTKIIALAKIIQSQVKDLYVKERITDGGKNNYATMVLTTLNETTTLQGVMSHTTKAKVSPFDFFATDIDGIEVEVRGYTDIWINQENTFFNTATTSKPIPDTDKTYTYAGIEFTTTNGCKMSGTTNYNVTLSNNKEISPITAALKNAPTEVASFKLVTGLTSNDKNRNAYVATQAELKTVEEQLENKSSELDATIKALEASEKTVEDKNAELAEKRAEIEELQTKLSKMTTNYEDSEQKRQALLERIDLLIFDIGQAKFEKMETKAAESFDSNYEKNRKRLEEERLKTLADVTAAKEKADAIEVKIKEKENEKAEAVADRKGYDDKIKEYLAEIERLESELEETADQAALKLQIQHYQSEVNAIQQSSEYNKISKTIDGIMLKINTLEKQKEQALEDQEAYQKQVDKILARQERLEKMHQKRK